MLYRLSKLVPVRMRSTYNPIVGPEGTITHLEQSTWWQWRDRIWAHRTARVVH